MVNFSLCHWVSVRIEESLGCVKGNPFTVKMHPQGRFADVFVGIGLRADPRNGVEAVPYRIIKPNSQGSS
jgi:hypothetical protein